MSRVEGGMWGENHKFWSGGLGGVVVLGGLLVFVTFGS